MRGLFAALAVLGMLACTLWGGVWAPVTAAICLIGLARAHLSWQFVLIAPTPELRSARLSASKDAWVMAAICGVGLVSAVLRMLG